MADRGSFWTTERRVHGALVVSLGVSIASNVLAAEPTLVGRLVAGWPPVALLLTVDVVGRVRSSSGVLSIIRFVATAVVALVAAVASFSHMRHVALLYGESELVGWLFPLTVDGVAVVCSVALIDLKRLSASEVAPTKSVPENKAGPSILSRKSASEPESEVATSVNPPVTAPVPEVSRSPQIKPVFKRPLTPSIKKIDN